ncbi:hypothetical protein [Actinacidiphila paucisporea]|uniref:Galactose mutarotase n=1 Tax=Actinacidiphila paucisporea TaxID=310782 RepID=A0A1M7QGG6_9ACTN|nr:hypothetical protein [Actinacidiphila paucisporea]SHN30065.1 hypothetical protein SAMN05216499_13442 [Actinacidiphila paucisporea]
MVTGAPVLRVATDPAHGGRWTSLSSGAREWLWHRDEPRRLRVRPGDAFADAGGLEECVPTVRGRPDHGDAWSRPWTRDGDTASVRCPDFHLTRTIAAADGGVVADYRLRAEPGYRFLWAGHALLDVSEHGRIVLSEGAPARLYRDGGSGWEAFAWPRVGAPDTVTAAHRPGASAVSPAPVAPDLRFDLLGPDDGTALGAIVDTARATVHDAPDGLEFALEAPDQPVSVAVWRNLRGFPEDAPYRSIGVEPMLGRAFDLAASGERDAARVPASGEVRWRLMITPCR